MPRVSRRNIKKEIAVELEDNFALLISSLSKRQDIQEFFSEFLTAEEKIMLAKRLMIYILLENNYTSLEIQSVLNISKDTTRIHKNNWNNARESYKKTIRTIVKHKSFKNMLQIIDRFLKPVGVLISAKTNMKARAKLASGDIFD